MAHTLLPNPRSTDPNVEQKPTFERTEVLALAQATYSHVFEVFLPGSPAVLFPALFC